MVITALASTAVGDGALLSNTGNFNMPTGFASLVSNSSGSSNTANGALALGFNTTGSSNTATGTFALFVNTEGENNTAKSSAPLQTFGAPTHPSRFGASKSSYGASSDFAGNMAIRYLSAQQRYHR